MVYPNIADLKGSIDERVYTNNTYAVTAEGINGSFKDTIDTLAAMIPSGGSITQYANIIVIDPNGDDNTGEIGISKPFATFQAANIAAGNSGSGNILIIVNPGVYLIDPTFTGSIFQDFVNYYFHPEAIVQKQSGPPLVYNTFKSNVFGYGVFLHNTTPVFVPLEGSFGTIEFVAIQSNTQVAIEINMASGGGFDGTRLNFIGKNFTDTKGGWIISQNGSAAVTYGGITSQVNEITFENCRIQNNGSGPAVNGDITGTVSNYMKLSNCRIYNSGAIPAPAIATVGTTVLYNTHVVTQNGSAVGIDIQGDFYFDNNVISNKPVSVTGGLYIGPAAGITVNPACDRIF